MTLDEARRLAAIFAQVECRGVLANECSWAWPELPWHELLRLEKAKEKVT